MPVFQNARLVAYGAACLALLWCGWWVRGLVEDKKDLIELTATDRAIQASMSRESEIASHLESRLAELRANERVIEREKVRIVERPVYSNVCLDADGVQLINRSKAYAPAKPADAVP